MKISTIFLKDDFSLVVAVKPATLGYDEYHRDGLPITSCYIKSTVKQVNARVKGTEKFWSPRGGEALLQLRADYLSENETMTRFWSRRQSLQTGHRPTTPQTPMCTHY